MLRRNATEVNFILISLFVWHTDVNSHERQFSLFIWLTSFSKCKNERQLCSCKSTILVRTSDCCNENISFRICLHKKMVYLIHPVLNKNTIPLLFYQLNIRRENLETSFCPWHALKRNTRHTTFSCRIIDYYINHYNNVSKPKLNISLNITTNSGQFIESGSDSIRVSSFWFNVRSNRVSHHLIHNVCSFFCSYWNFDTICTSVNESSLKITFQQY